MIIVTAVRLNEYGQFLSLWNDGRVVQKNTFFSRTKWEMVSKMGMHSSKDARLLLQTSYTTLILFVARSSATAGSFSSAASRPQIPTTIADETNFVEANQGVVYDAAGAGRRSLSRSRHILVSSWKCMLTQPVSWVVVCAWVMQRELTRRDPTCERSLHNANYVVSIFH